MPKPKERPRRGRGGHFYTPKTTQSYERDVGLLALQARQAAGISKPFTGQVSLEVEIQVPFGMTRKFDLDNAGKAIADAINKIAYDDDRQIVEFSVFLRPKENCEPTTYVQVSLLEEP